MRPGRALAWAAAGTAMLLGAGCSRGDAEALRLKTRAELLREIPVGTSYDQARRRLEALGFDAWEDRPGRLLHGRRNQAGLLVRPVDLVTCSFDVAQRLVLVDNSVQFIGP